MKELQRLKGVQEEMRANNRAIGEVYQFVDPVSGERFSAGIVTEKIQLKIALRFVN